jgi:putative endopeptidase
MKKTNIIFSILVSLLVACTQSNKDAKPYILTSNIDTSISPSEDFFLYANGRWLKNNPIPDEETSWGIFQLVQNEIYSRLRTVNENAITSGTDPSQKKIADFWKAGMDSLQAEKQGLKPLSKYLTEISELKNISDLIKVASDLRSIGVNCLFLDDAMQDVRNSDSMVYIVWQGGIGLPDRDYYFNTDSRNLHIQNEYIRHIEKTLRLSNMDSVEAVTQSKAIFNLEKSLASSSRKLEDLRDPYANFNKYAITDLKKISPSFDWKLWMAYSKISKIDSFVIGQPDFIKGLGKLVNETPIKTWKSYFSWHLLRTFSPYLSNAFVEEHSNFYSKILSGAKKIRPRWKRVLDAQERGMGELLGHAYVKEYFNENTKHRYINMVSSVKDALKNRILKLDWMGDSTKKRALQKLASMKEKVGYPDKWKDFSALEVNNISYAENMINCNKWWRNYSISKLGKPVNREEWDMTPQTYNAYYSPQMNEIVLPAAAFIVPGFRDEELDDALVYGYMGGSTIGHEITHGFDDQGRQFDESGNLKEWWTKQDEEKFTRRAAGLVKQYNEFIPVDTMHINGKATLGENVADLGGILLGWDAFKNTDDFKSGKKIAGLSPEKRFFLGYGLSWMLQERKESLAVQLLSDVHSPVKYRVNGPLVNVDAFYEVFQIKPGTKMYRADSLRTRIW